MTGDEHRLPPEARIAELLSEANRQLREAHRLAELHSRFEPVRVSLANMLTSLSCAIHLVGKEGKE